VILGNLFHSIFSRFGRDENLAKPLNLTAVWVDDFCRLTVDDIIDDLQIEWYESKDGGEYTLVNTTGVNVVTYDNYTWQGENMSFKCRAKKINSYSVYSDIVSIVTPFVFWTDQSTLVNLRINVLNISAGKSATINYGDGSQPVNKNGSNSNIDYSYSSTGQYAVKISGDVKFIYDLRCFSQTSIYGSMEKQVLKNMINMAYYSTRMGGDITNIELKTVMGTCYMHRTNITGNVEKLLNSKFTVLWLSVNNVNGDISNFIIDAGQGEFYIHDTEMSGKTNEIVDSVTTLMYLANACRINECGTTSFRRGLRLYSIAYQKVSFPTAEIDKLLNAAKVWFTTTAPTQNSVWAMNGANMGIPSAQGLLDRTALIGLYTAQGKTCTVTVQS
jgi:hypothetical protein